MRDLIDRQAVIDSLYDWSNHSMTDAETWHLRQVIGDIKSMPSVTPQESKTGHWIMKYNYFTGESIYYAKCSLCGEDSFEEGNYCHNCGAKMIGPQESKEKK